MVQSLVELTDAQRIMSRRRAAIIEFVRNGIATQESLVAALRERGFCINQATISRDLKFLNVAKRRGKYEL